MTDKLYSLMPPAVAAIVEARDKQLQAALAEDTAALIAAGATHNDLVSALSEWAALFVGRGQEVLVQRQIERFGDRFKDTAEIALDIFLRDVAGRTRPRR